LETNQILKVIYTIFKDFQGTLLGLLTLLLTYPMLKKKLIENHLSKSLGDIQNANKVFIRQATELIDELIPHSYKRDWIEGKEISYLNDRVKHISIIAQEANQDSNTIIFFLKSTLSIIQNRYSFQKHGRISISEIVNLIIEILHECIFLSTQVAPIPKSTQMIKSNLINKKIEKFVSHSQFEKYRYFNQGIIHSKHSAHLLLFYSKVQSCSRIIVRSAFQVSKSINPILNFLFLNDFYAPPILKMEPKQTLFDSPCLLYLIDFKINNNLSVTESRITKRVELIYTNPIDNFHFTENLQQETFIKEFKDEYLSISNFNLKNMKNYRRYEDEIISIDFDADYIESMFRSNKSNMIMKMKKSVQH